MKEEERIQGVTDSVIPLRQELEATDEVVSRFLSRASAVEGAYTQAMERVRLSVNRVGQSLSAVAAVGMNLFSRMLDAIAPAVNRLAALVVKVFGATVWTSGSKAMNDTAGSLHKVAGATRSLAQAQRQLMAFDQINRLDAPKGGSSSGGSSGGGSGGSGAGSAQGQLTVIHGLIEGWAAKAAAVVEQIWEPFRAAWEQKGQAVLTAAQTAFGQLKSAAAEVGKTWLAIWTDGTGTRLVGQILDIVRNLCLTAGNLAERFRVAWLEGENGKRIMSALFSLTESVLGVFRDMTAATAIWASQLNLSPILSGFANLTQRAAELGAVLAGALGWAYTNILLPLAGWVIQSAGPASLNLLASAANLLTQTFRALQPVVSAVWNQFLVPLGQWSGSICITALQLMTQGFNTLSGVLGKAQSAWGGLKQSGTKLWEDLGKIFSSNGSSLNSNFDGSMKKLHSTATSRGNSISGSFKGVWSGITSCASQKLSSIGSSFDSLRKSADNVWNKLSIGASNVFSGIGNKLTTPFRNGLNAVISLVNRVIRKINSALNFSWSAVKVLGRTIVPAGSVTLARMPTISALAEGGITTGPAFSLIGEAGREAVLPLENNTGWMDQLALRLTGAMGQGNTVIQVHVGGERLAERVVEQINARTRATGSCPIYV